MPLSALGQGGSGLRDAASTGLNGHGSRTRHPMIYCTRRRPSVSFAQGIPINYEGASGRLDFDANNQVVDRVVHFKIVGMTFTDIAVYDCPSDPSCPKL
jgi:hypothetical protein